jgi:hypothetical protein
MSKKITPPNNAANMQNPNTGTPGVNRQYAQNESNKAKQKSTTPPPPPKKK